MELGVRVRGREYLRSIYAREYDAPNHLIAALGELAEVFSRAGRGEHATKRLDANGNP